MTVALAVLLAARSVELVGVADGPGVGLRGGADHRGSDVSVCGSRGLTVPTAHTPLRCRRCPGSVSRDEGQPGRQQVGHLHPRGGVGALLDSVTVKVILSPTLGVASLTVLVEQPGRPAGASRWRWRCCCPCSGRTGRRALMVPVLVCAAGLTTVASDRQHRLGAGGYARRRPRGRWRCRKFPGWGWPTRSVTPGRQQVGHLHAGGGVGAVVDDGDGEGDLVADVGRRVADRLDEQQVGRLRVHVRGVGVVGRCSGRTGRRPLMVAVLVPTRRVHDGHRDRQRRWRRRRDRADRPRPRCRCRRLPWLGVADTKLTPAGNRSVTCTPVAASGPALNTVMV